MVLFSTRVLVAFAALATVAHAGVVLTFDLFPLNTNQAMNQAYGDRVTATSDAVGQYGTFGSGFTPNVVVDYGGQDSAPVLTRWTDAYGDLTNVLENDNDGEDRLTVTLTADPGYVVQLFGFDLAGWPNADYTIPGVAVKGGAVDLFSETSVLVRGASGTPRHTSFDWVTPLSAQSLQIYIDLSQLGGSSDNIGIDNIAFAQASAPTNSAVPEPATWGMMAAASALLAGLGLRRRA